MSDDGQPTAAVPAGWYPDPGQPGARRWWDGTQWTAHTTPDSAATPAAATYAATSNAVPTHVEPGYAAPGYTAPGYASTPYASAPYATVKKSRKGLWITLGVVGAVVVVLVGIGVGLALHDRSGAKKVVSSYLSNLQSGNYAGAYQELCEADQLEVSEQQFATAKAADRPVSFQIDKVLVHGGSAPTAEVFYQAAESGGQLLDGELPAQKTNGSWQVCHALQPGTWIGIR